MAKVLVPLADGFEDIEAVTIVDVLRRGGVDVMTASVSDALDVKSAHGIVMAADALFDDVASAGYDAIVIPGGPGTDNLIRSAALKARLIQQKESGGILAAICAAPLVLTNAGVVDPEQHVTCYPTCEPGLDRPRAEAPVVEDGAVITGEAPGSALLFSLVVLKALKGEEAALRVAHGMVTDVL